MLNKIAFANSIAVLTAALYLLLHLIGVISRPLFLFLFNAQFFGADVASLLPWPLSIERFLGTFVTLVVSAWLLGYVWAWLYNRFAR
jgi:hypothetical protein